MIVVSKGVQRPPIYPSLGEVHACARGCVLAVQGEERFHEVVNL